MDSMEIVINLVHGQIRKGVRSVVKDERGATLVEYVVLMVAVMLLCVAAFKALAGKITGGLNKAGGQL
jgi:Flp pilus assembly pilin Flp